MRIGFDLSVLCTKYTTRQGDEAVDVLASLGNPLRPRLKTAAGTALVPQLAVDVAKRAVGVEPTGTT